MNKQRREENENVGSDGREKESVAARQGGFPCYQPLFPTSSPPWPSSSKAVQITTCLISKSSFNIRPPLSPHPYIALTLSSVLPSFNPSCLKNVDGVDIHRQMVSPPRLPPGQAGVLPGTELWRNTPSLEHMDRKGCRFKENDQGWLL